MDMDYWGSQYDSFYLRAPDYDGGDGALVALPGFYVTSLSVVADIALVPAFELNLSNVSFVSAAPAASSGGSLEVQDVVGKDVDNNGKVTLHGAFTLRYRADNLGSAEVSFDKSKVTLTGVPKDKDVYLVVQNSAGAKAKQVTDQTTSVSASDMELDSFANCKVWLETTDTTNRMTYATLATDGQPIELPAGITFESQHIGYDDVVAQTVEMKNIGNAEISNINAVLTGENTNKFTLDTAGMQTTLAPNGTTSFTVKSKNDLGIGTYTAYVQVTGTTGVSKTIPVSFTVEGHTYKDTWVKDETGHWHACDCGAKADEDRHTFKWVIDKEATDKEIGSKHEECSVCGYKKASVEIPVLTPTNPDKSNTDKGSVETGDQTNVGLFTSLSMISALGIAVLTVWKKKKALESK